MNTYTQQVPLQIKAIKSQQQWDKIVRQFPDHTFLQSFAWGNFQETLGNKVYRFIVTSALSSQSQKQNTPNTPNNPDNSDTKNTLHADNNDQTTPIAAFQAIQISDKYTTYIYVPYGPLVNWGTLQTQKLSSPQAHPSTATESATPTKSNTPTNSVTQEATQDTAINTIQTAEVLKLIMYKLTEIGRDVGASHITIDPQVEKESKEEGIVQKLGLIAAPRYIQAQHKWLLDLTQSEEEMLLAY